MLKKYCASALVLAGIFFTFPLSALAYPFGGMINQIVFCYNNAIYTSVGPPNGGPFIWTPSTRTYQFGPPLRTGQWLLGLVAPPYYCLVSIQPIIVWSGVLMTMEGSSAPTGAGQPVNLNDFVVGVNEEKSGPGGGTGVGTGGTPSGIDHLVISEVYYLPDEQHAIHETTTSGGDRDHRTEETTRGQWVELYNPTGSSVNLDRWLVRTSSTVLTLPQGLSIPAKGYIVLTNTAQSRTVWSIPAGGAVRVFSNVFTGFYPDGDHVFLIHSSGARVDAMSWGSDKRGFSPSAPAVKIGHSLTRRNLLNDTNAAKDWVESAGPTPGR